MVLCTQLSTAAFRQQSSQVSARPGELDGSLQCQAVPVHSNRGSHEIWVPSVPLAPSIGSQFKVPGTAPEIYIQTTSKKVPVRQPTGNPETPETHPIQCVCQCPPLAPTPSGTSEHTAHTLGQRLCCCSSHDQPMIQAENMPNLKILHLLVGLGHQELIQTGFRH